MANEKQRVTPLDAGHETALQQNALQQKMASEVAQGAVFEQAAGYGRQYLRDARSRNVAPTAAAVVQLEAFHQPLPEQVSDAREVLEQLHEVGSPATMAQTSGRFVIAVPRRKSLSRPSFPTPVLTGINSKRCLVLLTAISYPFTTLSIKPQTAETYSEPERRSDHLSDAR